MIAHLRGTLLHKKPGRVTLDVGGVGYKIFIPLSTYYELEGEGTVVAFNHHPRSVLGVEEAFADPTLLRLVHPETMRGLFERAGFREVEVTPAGEFSQAEKKEWEKKLGSAAVESGDLAELLFAPRRYLLEARR